MQTSTIPLQYVPVSQIEFANIQPSVLEYIVVNKISVYTKETVNSKPVVREGIPAMSMIGFLGPPYFYRPDGTPYTSMEFYVPPEIATAMRPPPSSKSRSKTRRQRRTERRSKK